MANAPLDGGTPGPVWTGATLTQPLSIPNYQEIIDRLLAPLRARQEAYLKSLQAQTEFGSNLARSNSALAQQGLDQGHHQAVKSILDTLGARGLLDSGDTHYQKGQENNAYQQATTQQQNSLLAALTSLQDQLTNARNQAASDLEQALLSTQEYVGNTYTPTVIARHW